MAHATSATIDCLESRLDRIQVLLESTVDVASAGERTYLQPSVKTRLAKIEKDLASYLSTSSTASNLLQLRKNGSGL